VKQQSNRELVCGEAFKAAMNFIKGNDDVLFTTSLTSIDGLTESLDQIHNAFHQIIGLLLHKSNQQHHDKVDDIFIMLY
jgi:hypothetical protein